MADADEDEDEDDLEFCVDDVTEEDESEGFEVDDTNEFAPFPSTSDDSDGGF